MAMLLTEVQAVRAMLEAMKDKPGCDLVKEGQAARLLALVRKSKISVANVPPLLSEVSQCGFAAEACGDLNRAISERTGMHGVASPRPKLQDFTSIGNYFMHGQ